MATDADTRARGAHFLDPEHRVVADLVKAAALRPGETVLDAGAGKGAITGRLCDAVSPGGRVVAVERQPELVFRLKRLGKPGLEVIAGDILAVRLPTPLDAVVANPPYRLLPAIVKRLLAHGFGRAVLVVPLEFADRLCAQPKEEGYGRLTVEIGILAKTERLFGVPRRAFDPVPAVASTVIRLVPRPGTPMADIDDFVLSSTLDAAWDGRAKTLRHALSPLDKVLGLPPQEITEAIEMVKGTDRRFADVSPWEWSVVARHLSQCRARRKATRDGERDARKESQRLARMDADAAKRGPDGDAP